MDTKIAFLFPGQGSQYVGMTKDILEVSGFARKTFMKANEIMGIDLKEVCFSGPIDKLRQTQFTQPAIYTHSYIVCTLLKEKTILPNGVAGHSLGEYSALTTAGAFSFEEGLKLVKLRGELMQNAGEKKPGTMAAIIGMKAEEVEDVCEEAQETGIVQPANFNCPGQIVISGDIDAVHKALEIAKGKGCRLAKELVVGGAFHSPLMEAATQGLIEALDNTDIKDIKIPLYANVTGKAVTKADEIRELLKKQLLSPVQWEETMKTMVAENYELYIEVGPGSILQGLLKRIDRNAESGGIDRLSDLDRFQIE
ncbi:MAG: ACP S-malonyltransferase [Calditrichia bacterium]|nr:ACP S-malonyltransferase [Calditrichia bacterium]